MIQSLRKQIRFLAVLALFASPNLWAAPPFSITPSADNDPLLNDTFDDLLANLTEAVNDTIFTDENQAVLADGMAGANASGSATTIVDRALEPTLFNISVGGQVSVFGVDQLTTSFAASSNELPSIGAAIHGGVTAGVNLGTLGLKKKLGPIDFSRLKAYGSFLNYTYDSSTFSAAMQNYGLNLQYKLVPAVGLSFLAKWGGIDVTTGMNYIRNRATYQGNLNQSSSDGTNTLSFNFDYDLGVESKMFYIPLEVSTSVRLLYIFSAYGGVAADLNFGSAGLVGGGSGEVTATTNLAPVSYEADAVLDLDEHGYKASPSFVNPRGFIGGQLNFPLAQVGGQVSVSSNGTMGFGLYARMGF